MGGDTVGLGTGVLFLALGLTLPWISIPGGAIEQVVLARRGLTPVASGAVWRASPRLAVLLALLLLAGATLVFLRVRSHARARPVSLLALVLGAVVLAVTIGRLILDRPGADYTTIGAGGLFGVAGAAVVALAALPEAFGIRLPEVQPARLPTPWPTGGLWGGSGRAPGASTSRTGVAAGVLTLLVLYVSTRAVFAHRFPYFLDEGLFAEFSKLGAHSTADLNSALRIGQGPMLTWLSVVWVKLGFAPLTAIRLVSVTSGLLTVGVIGWLARSLWGAAAGWVAATLAVIVPFLVVHDGIGIYEPLITLILTAALLLQLAMARRPSLRLGAGLGLLLGAGILTKQNALPALVLLPVSLLCFDWSHPDRHRRLRLWLLGAGLVVVCVAAASLLPRLSRYYPEFQQAHKRIDWPARSVGNVLRAPYAFAGLNWDTYRPALVGYMGLPLLAASLAGAGLVVRRNARLGVVLLAWILFPFAIAMAFELRPEPRHAMFLVPPLILLASYALVEAGRLAGRALPRRPALAVGVAGSALLLASPLLLDARVLAHPATARYPGHDYWQYVAGWPAGGPWGSTADALADRAGGGPAAIVTPGDYRILQLLLDEKGSYALVAPGTPAAARARFAVIDSNVFPIDPKGLRSRLVRTGFIPVARFARPSGPCSGPREPGCGGIVTLFERPPAG